jgi:hypothetical protein
VSDDRLRGLERRWRASGALDDEVAWLSGRVRAGDLTRERIQIAALLGHSAAREVWSQDGDLLLARAAAAEFARTSPGRLVKWRERGLPCHRVGRRVFYDPVEILAFLESREENDSSWTIRPLGLLGDLIEVRDYDVGLRALHAALSGAEPTPSEWWDLASRLRVASAQLEIPHDERDAKALVEARDHLAYGRDRLDQQFADALRIFVDGLRHGPSKKPKIGWALERLTPGSGEARILKAIREGLLPWLFASSS